mgnify:CR=1 FL=1
MQVAIRSRASSRASFALWPSPVPESPASLTQEDKAAAYDAAMDYYAGTVFDVHSLTQIDALEGEIMFQVETSGAETSGPGSETAAGFGPQAVRNRQKIRGNKYFVCFIGDSFFIKAFGS